ncbi:MAG: hypothetical protein ACI3XG_02115 [Faecousia sp.]
MQYASGILLAAGWTAATPQFLPQAKMQIESTFPHQKSSDGICRWSFFLVDWWIRTHLNAVCQRHAARRRPAGGDSSIFATGENANRICLPPHQKKHHLVVHYPDILRGYLTAL